METCSNCSRPYGIARADETFYLGDSEAHALSVYAAVEASFFESSESA